MNKIDTELLRQVADLESTPKGAYNIRKNGRLEGRASSANIVIESKTDKPGIDIRIAPGTKNESVHIPVILTETGLNDMVYNDFFVGEAAATPPSTTASIPSTWAKTPTCATWKSTTARARAPASGF